MAQVTINPILKPGSLTFTTGSTAQFVATTTQKTPPVNLPLIAINAASPAGITITPPQAHITRTTLATGVPFTVISATPGTYLIPISFQVSSFSPEIAVLTVNVTPRIIPAIDAVAPSSITIASLSTTLRISGTNFAPGGVVFSRTPGTVVERTTVFGPALAEVVVRALSGTPPGALRLDFRNPAGSTSEHDGLLLGRRHAASQQNERSPGLRRTAAASGHTATRPACGYEQRSKEVERSNKTIVPTTADPRIQLAFQKGQTMRKLMPIALLILCSIGSSSNAFAANCFCKFYVNGTQIGSTSSPSGGFLQTTCAAQTGCHNYCNGYLAAGNMDAVAAAHRCGTITITMQSSVGTEGYCSNGLNTKPVTGTGVLSCPAGYWSEPGYMSQPNHPVCVKQACPQGTMPGAPPWHLIFGNPSSGGAYLTDDHGGTRFFIDANCH